MRCPPSLALLHFARGTASEPQQQAIAAHVAGCPACTARLRQAAHGSAATGPVPSPPTRPVVPPPPMPPGPAAPLPDYGDDVATRVQAITPRPGMVDEDARTAPPPSRRAPIVEPSGALTLGVTPPSIHDPPTPISAAFETSPATGRAELPRGTPLGRYLVVEPLGSGGLGDVYTAYDPELDRCVAIKVLRPSADETDSWDAPSGSGAGVGSDRLIREAKALARLSHPNVVAIYDVGRLGGDVFIAMERVEGLTLSQWSRAAERSWTQVRDVFLGAGEGLAAAHDAGIVHRDFKPANVIVDPDGRARVLDFGLARAVHREDGSGLIAMPRVAELRASRSGESLDGPVTMEGTVMGTPQYMAPEQFEGSEHTGPAADQFGFCVAMWEALYRERPFQGEGIAELIQAIRAGRITEPSEDRDVPPWLQLLLRRGLSVDPQARFGSMQELLHQLQRDRRTRRRGWLGMGAVVLATALGAAGAAVILQPPVTDEHRSRVDALADEARDAAARSYFVYPSSDDDDAVTAYRKVLELEALEGPAERLADERAAQLRQELAQTLRRLGDRFYEREGGRAFAADYYAAALVFDPDDEHARSRTSLTPGEVAQLRSRAADGSFAPAELAAAASLAVLAVEDDDERRERLVALYASDQAPSPTTSARIEALVGERDTEAIARAVQPRRRARAKGTAEAADANTPEPEPEPEPEPSGVEDDAGEPAATADRRDPGKARELANKGIAAFERGDFTTAESLLHRALGHDRRNAAALGGLAELYFERGSYQKASQYAAKAVSAAPRSGKYRIVLGDAHFKSLSYASARREYEKARSLGHPKAAGRLALLDKRLGE